MKYNSTYSNYKFIRMFQLWADIYNNTSQRQKKLIRQTYDMEEGSWCLLVEVSLDDLLQQAERACLDEALVKEKLHQLAGLTRLGLLTKGLHQPISILHQLVGRAEVLHFLTVPLRVLGQSGLCICRRGGGGEKGNIICQRGDPDF